MPIKLQSLKADLARENEGDWVEIPELPGVRLKVRSFHSPAYKTARDLAVQRLFRKFGKEPVPPETLAKEYGRLYAEHILLGWDGFDTAYTPELALELLADPAWRALFAAIEYAANKLADVETEFVESAEKN